MIESSDLFQTEHCCGGYDADERAFCFSHYDADGKERWFQVTLSEVQEVFDGNLTSVPARDPES